MLDFKEILKAEKRIDKYIYKTPLEKSIYLSNNSRSIYLKLENQQRMKCAKIRGALNKIISLDREEKGKGIAAISSGNHGAAVSYASSLLGIEKSTVYVPTTTPKVKLDKIKYYGAKIEKVGINFDQANTIGLGRIKENKATFIDPSSDKSVIAGQGTIGLEILEENPNIDTILVPIGGGGIISGISLAVKTINPDIKVIGLQTSACPAMLASMRDNKFYQTYPNEDSICDALVGGVGYIPYQMSRDYIDDIILVEEIDILDAVKHLLFKEKMVVEPAGAIGVVAVRKNYKLFKNRKVAIVITGGNLDKELISRVSV